MTAQITRTQYKQARRLLRDNGKYALRWLEPEARQVMEMVVNNKDAIDPLAERAKAIATWRAYGLTCSIYQTRAEIIICQQAATKGRQSRAEALAKYDRERAQAQRMNGEVA